MNEILQLIGSYGFPMIACIIMALYIKEINKQQRNDVLKLNKQHTEEMLAYKEEIKEALNNNTIALTKLCEKLEKGDN